MILLRPVEAADVEQFFEHQSEPEAVAMAAWPARDRTAHFAHWRRILDEPDLIAWTVLEDGRSSST